MPPPTHDTVTWTHTEGKSTATYLGRLLRVRKGNHSWYAAVNHVALYDEIAIARVKFFPSEAAAMVAAMAFVDAQVAASQPVKPPTNKKRIIDISEWGC